MERNNGPTFHDLLQYVCLCVLKTGTRHRLGNTAALVVNSLRNTTSTRWNTRKTILDGNIILDISRCQNFYKKHNARMKTLLARNTTLKGTHYQHLSKKPNTQRNTHVYTCQPARTRARTHTHKHIMNLSSKSYGCSEAGLIDRPVWTLWTQPM